jgi:hypothetical protein
VLACRQDLRVFFVSFVFPVSIKNVLNKKSHPILLRWPLTLFVSQNILMEQPGQAIPTEGFHE